MQMIHSFSATILADFLSELSGFPHLTTLVFELPDGSESQRSWPKESAEALALATGFMRNNSTLKRVAFEMESSPTIWPCYIRAQAGCGSHRDDVAVFEGFDILGPESWRDI
jgi:hypothetical protein